jgi:exodeoxyribonuclease-3
MRIVAWNCRMGFAKKRDLLYRLCPDIAVISECSRDSMLASEQDGYDSRWWGENKNKGLGVLARKPWTLEGIGKPGPQPLQKWIAPVRVQGPTEFLLLAVWAGRVGYRKEMNYVGQIHEAVIGHPEWFAGDQPVVMGGDFNSNAIWDSERKTRTHSRVVELLQERNLVSTYHRFFSEDHGQETRPTHFQLFSEHPKQRFHIDYIFIPGGWAIKNVEVGIYEKWCKAKLRSDHAPVIVDVTEKIELASTFSSQLPGSS